MWTLGLHISSSAQALCKNLPLGHHLGSLRGAVHSQKDEPGEEALETDLWPFGPGIALSQVPKHGVQGSGGAFCSAPQILCPGAGPAPKCGGPGKRPLQAVSKGCCRYQPDCETLGLLVNLSGPSLQGMDNGDKGSKE